MRLPHLLTSTLVVAAFLGLPRETFGETRGKAGEAQETAGGGKKVQDDAGNADAPGRDRAKGGKGKREGQRKQKEAVPETAPERELPENTREDPIGVIGAELVLQTFEALPWLAEERGWLEESFGLYPRTSPDRIGWVGELEDLAKRLKAVSEDLTPQLQAERRALASHIGTEIALLETRAPERWNPVLHIEGAERLLLIKQSSGKPAKMRRLEILQILRALPAYWARARKSLVSPRAEWTNEGIARLRRLELFLQSRREEFIEQIATEATLEQLTAVYDDAFEATRAFRKWLDNNPVRIAGGGATRVGSSRWEALVKGASGSKWSVQELKWRVLRDLASLEREHGPRWRAQAGGEVDADLIPRLDEILSQASERGTSLVTRAGLPFEADTRAEMSFALNEIPQLFSVEALLLPGRKGIDRALVDPESLRGADSAKLDALGLRYGFPGQALFRREARSHEDPIVRYLWNRSVLEGWGLYTLDWIHRVDWVPNQFHEDSDFAAEVARVRVLEGARLLAALEVHSENLTLAEAAEGLRRRAGLTLTQALEEAQQAIDDPLRGIGYLGWVELRALEARFAVEASPARAIGQVLSVTMAAPHFRPVDHP